MCSWSHGVDQLVHSIEVDGQVNTDAAWYYPDTLPAADSIKGRVAFWKGVTVERG